MRVQKNMMASASILKRISNVGASHGVKGDTQTKKIRE